MTLKSLTYTSLASLDLTSEDVENILRSAREQNAIEGITGLLVFNGTHFMQVVEGSTQAIDDLVERLRRDRRHSGVEIRDQREIQERFFPDWTMELVRVKSRYREAQQRLRTALPEALPPAVGERLVAMTASISGDVDLVD
ncbi:BLUF domain-containing protein [Sphingomonas arenae]|uniref:BLUF domain-containing protein n=1 Tax=Sphingomonas arenae TaxID=2812555 RepID=UPI0019679D97|nr:BLUF domain-containing protein [Sphingomonas arenae]